MVLTKGSEGKRNPCTPYPSCNEQELIELRECQFSLRKCKTRKTKRPPGTKLAPIRKTWTRRKKECDECFHVCRSKAELLSEFRDRRGRMLRMATACSKLKNRLRILECFHVEKVCRRQNHYPDGEKANLCRECTKVCGKASAEIPNVNFAAERCEAVAKHCNVEKIRFCPHLRDRNIPLRKDVEFSKYCGE